MIKKEPKKSYEIMGADVKQTGEQFGKSAKYLRWQDKAANQKFFAGELQHVQQGSRRPAAGDRHHQGDARRSTTLVDTQLHQVGSVSAGADPLPQRAEAATSRDQRIAGGYAP